MQVELASIAQIDGIWPHIRDGMVRSCKGGNMRAGYVWQQCRSGNAHLLIAHDGAKICGAAVLQFEDYGKTLRGLALCGEDRKAWWPQMVDVVRQMVKDNRAERFIDEGRVGLKSIYPKARLLSQTYEIRP